MEGTSNSSQDSTPFGGMAPMYALMALFHAAPWVRLVGRQPA